MTGCFVAPDGERSELMGGEWECIRITKTWSGEGVIAWLLNWLYYMMKEMMSRWLHISWMTHSSFRAEWKEETYWFVQPHWSAFWAVQRAGALPFLFSDDNILCKMFCDILINLHREFLLVQRYEKKLVIVIYASNDIIYKNTKFERWIQCQL